MNVPAMEFSDANSWQHFKLVHPVGPYADCIAYAEYWARLMQLQMSQGKALDGVASEAVFESGLYNVDGYQFTDAIDMLSQCWIYGEELRKWYDHDCQIDSKSA